MHKPGVTTNPIGSRYWERGGRADNIVRINIPSEDVNGGRMREDIKVMGKSNTGGAGDTHLHLYRDNNGNPNASDQWLTGTYNDQNSIKKGQPCPGGDAYWKKAMDSEISCVYNVKTGSGLGRLQTLHGEIKNSFSGDPRKAMYTNLVNRYCNSATRLNDVISSDTSNNKCRDVVNSISLAKEYCKIGDNIATDNTFCTKEELSDDIYNELAETYCENNPDKDFCGCYNVMQPGLCEQVPNLPGCKTVKPVWDKITSSLDEGDIAQFEGMQPCYGSVCSGNVYQPTSWDANCNRDISICKADFDIGGDLVGSNISLKQDCGNNNEGGGGGGGGGGDGDGGGGDDDDDEEKSLTEKLFKFEEDKDKKLIEKQSTKIFGTVSSVSSCFMCMTALFGGDLTIDQFRENNIVDVEKPREVEIEPLPERVIPIVSNTKKLSDITSASGKNETLRLKREKPLKRNENNLETALGLIIKTKP
jgi:hypothetical protein